jgi:uncharacterized protein Yka (UPF0111/DUF47 family)
MSPWFLPETPDVLAMLHAQSATTAMGMDALVAWAGGDGAQGDVVRSLEHEADAQKRALRKALRSAFTTPMDAEDLYTLSELLDSVLNGAKDAVREAEVMATPPDAAVAEMAALLAEGVHHLDEGFQHLEHDSDLATNEADAAIHCQRKIEKVYRRAMSSLLAADDLREEMARRELYRRLCRLGDAIEAVAERIWYAVVKEG